MTQLFSYLLSMFFKSLNLLPLNTLIFKSYYIHTMRGKDATFWETQTTGCKYVGPPASFLIVRVPWEPWGPPLGLHSSLLFVSLSFVPKVQGPEPQRQAAHNHVSLLVSLVFFHSLLFM